MRLVAFDDIDLTQSAERRETVSGPKSEWRESERERQ